MDSMASWVVEGKGCNQCKPKLRGKCVSGCPRAHWWPHGVFQTQWQLSGSGVTPGNSTVNVVGKCCKTKPDPCDNAYCPGIPFLGCAATADPRCCNGGLPPIESGWCIKKKIHHVCENDDPPTPPHASTTPPHPRASTTPPSSTVTPPSLCPGGSLATCMHLCPSDPKAYQACVKECQDR